MINGKRFGRFSVILPCWHFPVFTLQVSVCGGGGERAYPCATCRGV